MGVIVGTTIPMFMGAMIVGPLGGWLIKKVDASGNAVTVEVARQVSKSLVKYLNK
jgi:mannitol-specific phosphotransferase system IIBC component